MELVRDDKANGTSQAKRSDVAGKGDLGNGQDAGCVRPWDKENFTCRCVATRWMTTMWMCVVVERQRLE